MEDRRGNKVRVGDEMALRRNIWVPIKGQDTNAY